METNFNVHYENLLSHLLLFDEIIKTHQCDNLLISLNNIKNIIQKISVCYTSNTLENLPTTVENVVDFQEYIKQVFSYYIDKQQIHNLIQCKNQDAILRVIREINALTNTICENTYTSLKKKVTELESEIESLGNKLSADNINCKNILENLNKIYKYLLEIKTYFTKLETSDFGIRKFKRVNFKLNVFTMYLCDNSFLSYDIQSGLLRHFNNDKMTRCNNYIEIKQKICILLN
jgi:hypothetical protein